MNRHVTTRRLTVTLASLVILVGAVGLVQSSTLSRHSSEVGFASFSPRGPSGGSIVPASCESGAGEGGLAHFDGDSSGDCYPDTVPIGFFDTANCTTLTGWAFDPDTQMTSITVHLYKNGPAGAGGIMVGAYTANIDRPDVRTALHNSPYWYVFANGNYGFSIPTPASLIDGVSHSLYVYGINASGPTNKLLTNSPRTILCSLPATATLSANPTKIDQGYASTISWNSTNATSCTGTGFATGGATSGSVSTGALNTVGTYNYQVTCTGPGGTSAPAFASVTVISPSVDISSSPPRVQVGSPTTLTWSAIGVSSCTVTGPSGTLASGPGIDPNSTFSSGSPSVVTISTPSTFTITCQTNSQVTITESITVNTVPLFEEF